MSKSQAIAGRLASTIRSGSSFLTPALLLLFLAAFLIRVWGLSYFHYWDEFVYLQDARVICCGKTNYSELIFRPPLLSLLFAGIFLLRDHLFAACIVTAALNALAPVLLFLSGRRIVGVLPAALASLLLAFGPFFVGVFPPGFDSDDTGNSLLTDSPALTLVLLALWLMLRALEQEKLPRFFLTGLSLSLAVLMRFGSIPAVGLLCLLPLAANKRIRACLTTAAGLLTGLAPYLLWSRIKYGAYLATLRAGWKNVEGPEPPSTFYLVHAPAIFTWIGVAGLLLAAISALVALYKNNYGWNKNIRPAVSSPAATPHLLRAFLWLWLFAGFIFFSRMPHKEPRYIMPLAPPLLLLAGSGLALFCRLRGRLLRPLGIVALAAAMVFTLFPSLSRLDGPFVEPKIPEERSASLFLNSTLPPNTTLYANFNYPAFAYYTSFPIHELPIGGPAVYQAIDSIPAGGILIAYRENESGEPRIDLLDRNPRFETLRRYDTLVIYRRNPPGAP